MARPEKRITTPTSTTAAAPAVPSQATAVPPTPPPPSRMSLDSVVKGRLEKPMRVLLYGVEGVGKSTFASEAPAPIFLGAEEGTEELDVPRFPVPKTWHEVLEALRVLTVDEHAYQTLVVDTLDWLEPLLWDHICTRDVKENVEDYGYGKGYQVALDEWRIFLAALERLRAAKSMHIILLAHSWIKPFKNPDGPDFDRYELKLHLKAAGLLKEWSSAVLFANNEIGAAQDERTKRFKGVSTKARVIFTVRTHAYDAKNRYDLPERMPLDWATFHGAVKAHRPAAPEDLIGAIRVNAERLPPTERAQALGALERAGNDPKRLAQLNSWVNGGLS